MKLMKKIKSYAIYESIPGKYIICDTRKDFQSAHTHVDGYSRANYVAYLAAYNKLPPKNKYISSYLIQSTIRISNSSKHRKKLQLLLEKRKPS